LNTVHSMDLFGRKRKKGLYDRAYAEFISGHFDVAIHFLNNLANEKSKNFNVYNLRAACFIQISDFPKAYHDSKISINLEPDINQNEKGYFIRNQIIELLKSGEIAADLYNLLLYFDCAHINEFVDEICGQLISTILLKHEQYKAIPTEQISYLFYEYIYWKSKMIYSKSSNFSSVIRCIEERVNYKYDFLYLCCIISDDWKQESSKTFLFLLGATFDLNSIYESDEVCKIIKIFFLEKHYLSPKWWDEMHKKYNISIDIKMFKTPNMLVASKEEHERLCRIINVFFYEVDNFFEMPLAVDSQVFHV